MPALPQHIRDIAATARLGFERTAARVKADEDQRLTDMAVVCASVVAALRSGAVVVPRAEPPAPAANLPAAGDSAATARFILAAHARATAPTDGAPIGADGQALDPGSLAAFIIAADRKRRGVA
jgi:hypothetical protein